MAPSPAHPRDPEAAEYVLGTLTGGEREAFEGDMGRDPALVAAVRAWEERLAGLAEQAQGVEPSPELWTSILTSIEARGEAPSADPQSGRVIPWTAGPDLIRLRRSRGLWRGAALASGALAATLALSLALPHLLPPSGPAGLVAVVNRSGELPALIVRVDLKTGTVQIRSVEAEVPAGRSLELWSIVGSDAPRSLGVVPSGKADRTVPPADTARLSGATLAVSVEPEGGSTTGAPTGPVVYQGKLIPDP